MTDIQALAFARTNGIYNAWPYWREFVQNMIARMNLPPLVIPVFRLFGQAPPFNLYEHKPVKKLAKRSKKVTKTNRKKAKRT